MRTNRVRFLEIVGIVTVVLSLLFVGYEIRQSNKIATVANSNEIYGSFVTMNSALMTDIELANLLIKTGSMNHMSDFTDSELTRISSWAHFLLNI